MLSARGITKKYNVGTSTLDVLVGIDLDIYRGEILAVIGESGAGKSTLLHILGMLDRPTSGTFELNGEYITDKSDNELATFRNKMIGFVFQFHHLLPEFSALENVMMPALIARKNGSGALERAKMLLAQVGLSDRIKHRPGELSGGELQRVAVARALMNEPAIVLADEPSGNLDHKNSLMLHDLMWNLADKLKYTFVIVTHDMALAGKADRIVQLHDGKIKEIQKQYLNELFSP
ncbi:MAG: ABC transporter ATP-binding protein [Candidatus Latescibacteria bacterium]|nr:ABC transporter ATP-binding protein [Candidatus Latescibacterota bacterium]